MYVAWMWKLNFKFPSAFKHIHTHTYTYTNITFGQKHLSYSSDVYILCMPSKHLIMNENDGIKRHRFYNLFCYFQLFSSFWLVVVCGGTIRFGFSFVIYSKHEQTFCDCDNFSRFSFPLLGFNIV